MSQSFEDSWSNSEKKNENNSVVPSGNSSMPRSLLMPRKWMMPKLFDDNLNSMMDMKDSNLLSMKNDDTKMERYLLKGSTRRSLKKDTLWYQDNSPGDTHYLLG